MNDRLRFFPDKASTIAGEVDALYWFLVGLTAFFTLLILVLIVYFVLKYRRRGEERPQPVHTSLKLELAWTIVPLIIVMGIFGWAAAIYVRMSRPPADAMEIYVIGRQWMWKIQHPQGRREVNELHVPAGRPIKLVMTSQDVIHSFYIPAFRVKQDVLPGRYSQLWFKATQPGEYHLFCAEYCGTQHSGMTGKVVVMEPAQYEAWLAGGPAEEGPAVAGAKLFAQYGCMACHGQAAPSLAGLYGRKDVVVIENGKQRTVEVNDRYIRDSILDPNRQLVVGYPPIMPSYRGQLSEEQVLQLMAYIKSLADVATTRESSAAGQRR